MVGAWNEQLIDFDITRGNVIRGGAPVAPGLPTLCLDHVHKQIRTPRQEYTTQIGASTQVVKYVQEYFTVSKDGLLHLTRWISAMCYHYLKDTYCKFKNAETLIS